MSARLRRVLQRDVPELWAQDPTGAQITARLPRSARRDPKARTAKKNRDRRRKWDY